MKKRRLFCLSFLCLCLFFILYLSFFVHIYRITIISNVTTTITTTTTTITSTTTTTTITYTTSARFVYQLTSSSSSSDGVQMQHIKAKGMKMTPGVSSFASHTHDLGDYFAPLFVNAASVVPPEHHAAMEVHILGTAGEI